MHILKNEFVEIGFDDRNTGAIVHLKNVKTGYQAISRPDLAMGLWMLIPTPQKRSHKAESRAQRLSSFSAEEGKVAMTYDEIIGADTGALEIGVSICAELHGPDICFTVSIQNRSLYTVEEVRYPCLGGLAAPQGQPDFAAKTLQFQGGISALSLSDGFPNPGYWGTDWPTVYKTYPAPDVSAPLMILENGAQGIYMGVHDEAPNFGGFAIEYRPGYGDSLHGRLLRDKEGDVPAGFVVSVTRLPFIAPGERMELSPVVLSMFEGDWHTGLKPYLCWRETWFAPIPRPEVLDETDLWLTLHINSPEGCRRHRYRELPGLMREAKKSGVKLLQLIGWARGGQDGDEPYQDVDPELGTREELREAIRQIEEMGIRVLLMCKFKWADQSTEEFKTELLPHTMKDVFGNPVHFGGYTYQTLLQNVSGGSRRSGAGLCHLSKGYRQIALRELSKILDFKPTGILYDELANPMLLCFDEGHGHRPGACHHVGSLELAREFYQAGTKALGPKFLMAGEGPIDPMCQYYWCNYIRSADKDHAPVWKYINPQMQIATCLIGFDDREMVNQCIAYGYAINLEPYNFKGQPSDMPLTLGYVQKASALRARLKAYLWTGTFRHTDGVEVAHDGRAECIYSLFVNPETQKRAVVVANQGQHEVLRARVSVPGASGAFTEYRPERLDGARSDGTVEIAPRSLCVLVEA